MKLGDFLKFPRLCKDGFFPDYLRYTHFQESPEDFHLWTGIGLISAALGRRVHINKGYYKIYPNLWICLVAESAALHKSTALNMGRHLLVEANPEHSFFAQKLTTEALIGTLASLSKTKGSAVATIFASEFSVFFGKAIHDPSLIQVLTDYYDCPDIRSYTTVGRGEEIMKNLAISMLAGTTQEWIKSSLPEDSVGGGFTSRLLFIYRTETEKIKNAFPEKNITREVVTFRDNCINDLKAISELEGVFSLDPSAEDCFQRWYEIHDIDKAPPGMRGYYGRKGDFILKLAMVISASRGESLVITEREIEIAVELLGKNEIFMEVALGQLSQTDNGKLISKVLEVIRRSGLITHSDLMKQTRHMVTSQELWGIINTLNTTKEIEVAKTPTNATTYAIPTVKKRMPGQSPTAAD